MQTLQTLSVHQGNGKDPSDGAYINCESTQCWLWPGWLNLLWAGLACWVGFLLHWLFARLALDWIAFCQVGFLLGLPWDEFAWAGSALGWVGFGSVWLWVVYAFPELDFCWLGFWLHALALGWVLDWLLLSWLLLSWLFAGSLAFY